MGKESLGIFYLWMGGGLPEGIHMSSISMANLQQERSD